MYGFGDAQEPYAESVEIAEHIVLRYIVELARRAMEVRKSEDTITAEDVVFAVRRDPKKAKSARRLVDENKRIHESRSRYDESTSKMILRAGRTRRQTKEAK